MRYATKTAKLFAPLAPVLLLSVTVGCGPALEQSSDAVALPAVRTDAPPASDSRTDWPGFRGANTSGVAPDATLPVRWSRDDGVAWSVEVPGEGNSSPVVTGEQVLLTTAVGSDASRTGVVLAYDRSDGRLRWKVEATSLAGDTHVKNGHASASVATDGERLIASFGSSGVFCYDLAGNLLWHAEVGSLDHVWGTASSPVFWRNLVIQLCDRTEESFLAAFDKASGEPIWTTPRDSYGSWSTPVLAEAEADGKLRDELIVNGTGTGDSGGGWMIAYRPSDGRELWRARGTTDTVSPTTIVGPRSMIDGGLVISTSGRNGPVIAIRPGGSGDVTLSRVVWKVRRGGAYVPTGLVYRNRLFTISDGGVAACYNAGNGEVIWRERLRGSFSASLVAGAGMIYATSERGTIHVFRAADEFELLGANEMGERVLATPAISNGDLFIRTGERLYCVASPPYAETPDTTPSSDDTVGTESLTDSSDSSPEDAEPMNITPPKEGRSAQLVSEQSPPETKSTSIGQSSDEPDR